jgi:hypothetical protein
MKILMLCICLMAQGCASHAVRCDAHLEPINPPAAKDSGNAE